MHITWTVYAPTCVKCSLFPVLYFVLCRMISLVKSVFFLSHVHLPYVYTVFHLEWQISHYARETSHGIVLAFTESGVLTHRSRNSFMWSEWSYHINIQYHKCKL